MSSTTTPRRRDLAKELQDGIKPWTGSTTFTTPLPAVSARGGGSSASPIDITASPEPVGVRVRGVVRYESALPRTAYTPPRVHPFFTQRSRTVPAPAPAPSSQRPRLVAHYSSTEASSSTSQSQSQSQDRDTDTQSSFGGHGPAGSNVKRKSKGKGKETSVHGAPPGWAEDAIDQIVEDFEKTRITRVPLKTRSTVTAPAGPATTGSNTAPIPPLPRSAQTRPPQRAVIKPNPKATSASASASKSTPAPIPSSVHKETLPFFHYADVDRAHHPKIAYTTSPSEADDLISCLRGDVLGFDLEWPPAGKYTTVEEKTGTTSTEWVGRTWDAENKKYVFTTGRTALVQVCDRDLIVLVHLKDMRELPQSIVDLVQDRSKYKLGVQVAGDGRKLISDFPGQLRRTLSMLELSRLARRVDGEAIGPGNTLISLAKLTERYLSRTLRKEAGVRRGNWSSALSPEQLDYAANDVYASYLVFKRLRALAEERSIDIDLPAFCSDLGDVLRPARGACGGGTAALARRASGSLSPSPAQQRTLEAFIAGQHTEEIAKQMGIQRSTVQGYLAGGLGRVHDDVLSDTDKRRFLEDVKDAYWVMRNHRAVIECISADLRVDEIETGLEKQEAVMVRDTQ